ncbi:hypothetical protein IFR05_007322 [Cadophora sp. M221]|nr:hypothetical protein IFR05_007322 [Cadophora sp. M221]
MEFVQNHNDHTEDQSGSPVNNSEGYPQDHSPMNPISHDGAEMEDDEEGFKCREQVRALQEHLRALKEVILESSDTFTNPLDSPSQLSPSPLQQQDSDREIFSELKSQHDSYYIRVQNLERRVEELLSLCPNERGFEVQDTIARRGSAATDRGRLSHEIHHEGGYLSPFQSLKLRLAPESIEADILAELDAAKAEIRTVEADRDILLDENADLRERLNTRLLGYETIIQKRNSLQTPRNALENQADTLVDQGIAIEQPEGAEAVTNRQEGQKLRTSQQVNNSPQPTPTSSGNDEVKAQLAIVRAERDSAIQQNEDARRTLATRTAERNGAHQRMRILEAAAKESQVREAQIQLEIRRKEKQEQTEASLLKTEISLCEGERKEVEFLQQELEHAVAAAAKAQHERDAARTEIEALEEENAIASSAAETTSDVVVELQQSLEAAKHAALAEREKSEESRSTQNRLRIERETVRMEVAQLKRELSAAHQISMGLVRDNNITVGDLVHIREEKDAALTRLSILQGELNTANETAMELQKALDDQLARHANGPTDGLALKELNRVIAQRDEALAHVKELERLLKELEDDYRKNLDQWERQTHRDEKEIHASKGRLKDEKKQNKELSDQLKAANAKFEVAETRARTAEEKLEIAEARSEAQQIQMQQFEQDLDHSNEDRDELECVRDRLQTECLQLGATITALRNEVIRLGGTTVDPDGTVQGEDGWPNGPPISSPDPRNIPHPSTAKTVPMLEDPDENEYKPFPHQIREPSVAESTRSQSSSSSSNISISSIESESDDSRRERSPSGSPFPSPRQKPPPSGSPATPRLQTNPTMSTRTRPRSTRNPAPDYGGLSRPKSMKREAEPDSEGKGWFKRKRSD